MKPIAPVAAAIFLLVQLLVHLPSSKCFAQGQIAQVIAKGIYRGHEIEYVEGELLLKVRSEVTAAERSQLFSSCGATAHEDLRITRWYKITLPADSNILQVIEHLRLDPRVEYAEPNGIGHYAEVTPNDTFYNPKQWALKNTGLQAQGAIAGSDIKASFAWDVTTGSDDVLVAVLDTGIPLDSNGHLSHPDLNDSDRIHLGADFTSSGEGTKDVDGHGTFVTGIIGANFNNTAGIASVAGGVSILVVKAFHLYGDIVPEQLARAIDYACSSGAHIANISGGWEKDEYQVVTDAIDNAQDVLFVVSAGNHNVTDSVWFPANLAPDRFNVVAVSATNHRDEFASDYSSHGPEVTVSAPGGDGDPLGEDDIWSTYPDYPTSGHPTMYGYRFGASYAAPHVAGVAALIWSAAPELVCAEVRAYLEQGVDDKGASGKDDYFGYGRINAYKAVAYANGSPAQVQNVQVVNYNDNPRISWNANQEGDLASTPYKVYRKINYVGGGVFQDWIVKATVSGTSYVDTDIDVLPKPYNYTIYYKLTATDIVGQESVFSSQVAIDAYGLLWKTRPMEGSEVKPTEFALLEGYPNPFNPSTTLRYELPATSRVSLVVYDVLGRQVAEVFNGHREQDTLPRLGMPQAWGAESITRGSRLQTKVGK